MIQKITILVCLTIKKRVSLIKRISRSCWKYFFFCVILNKAAGINQIPAKCLQKAANMLAYPLSQIMGLSVKLSLFPKECNIANLKQLLGKGSKTYPKN